MKKCHYFICSTINYINSIRTLQYTAFVTCQHLFIWFPNKFSTFLPTPDPKKSPAWNVNWSLSPMTYVYTSATYSPQCVHGYQNTKIRWSCCRSHPLIITRDHILNIIWFVKPAAIWMRHCIIWCIDKIKPSCKSNIKCSTEIVVSSSFFNSVYDHRSSNTICNDNVFPQPFFDEIRCLYNINTDNFVCLLPIAALSFAIKIFICHTIRAEILLFTLDDDIAFFWHSNGIEFTFFCNWMVHFGYEIHIKKINGCNFAYFYRENPLMRKNKHKTGF